jgi:hypothetical protein
MPGVSDMQQLISQRTILAMNFAVGVALVSMLSPHFGKPCDKPAGVRTAMELLEKRPKAVAIFEVAALG